jgi:D-alanyl-lipoteichoic acid acyltransferase DltB (MBOAT superfamily)
MSLVFYSWWDVKYLPLILCSMMFNYGLGTVISRYGEIGGRKRKLLLVMGIVVNVLLLGYYKYTDFVIMNINWLFGTDIGLRRIVLPLGISFFTFTQIAYLVDAYKAKAKEYDLLNYALFVTYFPHLLAGPIIHHREMMPQFESLRNKLLNYRNLAMGLFLFSIGLFKKVVIADKFALWANAGFDGAESLTMMEAWATSLSYTFQLYFDFSGYTDMALGSSYMFNIKLPINFHSPYKALDIQDFWRRWHMTLSRFLREYIYIPLGGNRYGDNRMYMALMATFLIGGIWHGAGWTFVFWGFLHGAGIVIHRIWKKHGLSMPKVLAWLVTFNFVNIAWVFFRAKSWGDAMKVLGGMFGMNGIVLPHNMEKYLGWLGEYGIRFGEWMGNMSYRKNLESYIIFFLIFCITMPNSNELVEKFKPDWKGAAFTILIALYAIFSMVRVSEFLYFNF